MEGDTSYCDLVRQINVVQLGTHVNNPINSNWLKYVDCDQVATFS